MEQIHGHKLIDLIARSNKALSLDGVKKLAYEKIGKNVLYYTCSEDSMDTDEMITFLLNGGKLVKKENGYVIDFGNVCDHD